jgi:hypothetical protein
VLFLLLLPSPATAKELRGHFELRGTGYPSRELLEARVRLFGRYDVALGQRWHLRAAGYLDGVAGNEGRGTDAVIKPHESFLEWRGSRAEVRLGFSNVVWGVLDEIQPTDVVNPIDVARFVVEGRAEARLPVPLVRFRSFTASDTSIEAIWVPLPRRGRFDQVGEESSPFLPPTLGALPRGELARRPSHMEAGARVRGTAGRVDWGASFFRDVADFSLYDSRPTEGFVPTLEPVRPIRWMVGGDLEAAGGGWVVRAEGALFLRDPLQLQVPPRVITATTFHGGLGADRRLGEARVFANLLYRAVPSRPSLVDRDEVSFVGGVSRDFGRGTRHVRVFGVYNARAGSAFLRAILGAEVVENLRVEASAGLFRGGDGFDTFALLERADFLVIRLRAFF